MNRRTLLAIVGGTLAVVLLWWFAILSPKRSATSTARAEADAAVARGQELEQTLARLRELDRNRPQIEADLRALNAAIPATPDLATFILSANEIAASSGVDFLSIAPSPPAAATTAGAPTSVALAIQVKGDFFAVVDYLNRLEDLERIVVVDDISLASGAGSSGSGAAGASGATGASSDPSALSVTLAARMFTRAVPSGATGTTGVTGATGTTGSTTTPTTAPTSSTGTP